MKNQKGITLIALVITIIVLLILAGITIAMLAGENGILTNATKSKSYDILGTAKDQVALAANEAITSYYSSSYVPGGAGTYTDDGAKAAVVAAINTKVTFTNGASFVKAQSSDPVVNTSTNKFTIQYGDYTVEGTVQTSGSIVWGDITDTRS